MSLFHERLYKWDRLKSLSFFFIYIYTYIYSCFLFRKIRRICRSHVQTKQQIKIIIILLLCSLFSSICLLDYVKSISIRLKLRSMSRSLGVLVQYFFTDTCVVVPSVDFTSILLLELSCIISIEPSALYFEGTGLKVFSEHRVYFIFFFFLT